LGKVKWGSGDLKTVIVKKDEKNIFKTKVPKKQGGGGVKKGRRLIMGGQFSESLVGKAMKVSRQRVRGWEEKRTEKAKWKQRGACFVSPFPERKKG